MESTRVPMRADGVLEADVDGQRILMSPSGFTYFGLVETGAPIWDLIDGQRSVDDLVVELLERYEGDPARIRTEVDAFLSGLDAAGLLSDGPTDS